MTHSLLLMEGFYPPRSPDHLRALGLPGNFHTLGAVGLLLRIEGLSVQSARFLNELARECGGRSRRLPLPRPGICILVVLPHEAREAFASRLRSHPLLRSLAGEIDTARRAARRSIGRLRLRRRTLPLHGRTLIQGILNVTPDSFSDGGRWADPARAVEHAFQMVEEGADLVDIGGESTRPGARAVPAHEEIRRVLPVIEALVGRIRVPLSVDTTKVEVAEAALGAGAELVNDISGLTFNPSLAETVARHGAGVILSHIKGRPRSMQRKPGYHHLLPEVIGFLQKSIRRALEAGVPHDAILVDPGIGFGKTALHNLLLLRFLSALHSTGCPILVGASRKSFLGAILGEGADRRLHGSLSVAALAVTAGASALRVHDVAATLAAVRVAESVREATMARLKR